MIHDQSGQRQSMDHAGLRLAGFAFDAGGRAFASMIGNYFNSTLHVASSRWDRAAFLSKWRRLHTDERRWSPPYYPALHRWLDEDERVQLIHLEAFRRRHPSLQAGYGSPFLADLTARTVATTVVRPAAPGSDTACLALFHVVNDSETLVHFLQELADATGARRFIGPTALSPYLAAGVQLNHWHEVAPLHAPQSPPYAAELFESHMQSAGSSVIYDSHVGRESTGGGKGPATLSAFDPVHLASDLFPLMVVSPTAVPDMTSGRTEILALLRWLGPFPVMGRLAMLAGAPVGFILMQADRAALLRRAGGGRFPWQRLWLRYAGQLSAPSGRLLFGGVLPDYRRRGIGRQLWQAALEIARKQGWDRISVGPVPEGGPGEHFLSSQGAVPRQRYRVYSWQARAGGWW